MSDDGYITGYFIRVNRDGKFQSIDIAALTDSELALFVFGLEERKAQEWVKVLAKWIRDNVMIREKIE